MSNPNGPYPGRQVFLGLTASGNPCFAYLVTGRSPASRERKAVARENTVIIGPLGDIAYDPLRHYSAVKYDDGSGVLAVSNGIQTDAIYETYRLLYNVGSAPTRDYMETIMNGAKYEPDSLSTPRVAGVVTADAEKKPVLILSMIGEGNPSRAYAVEPKAGSLYSISTYMGAMEKPESRTTDMALPEVKAAGETAEALAKSIFDLSAATNEGNDIRVCAVGGMLKDGKWSLAIINVHK